MPFQLIFTKMCQAVSIATVRHYLDNDPGACNQAIASLSV